MHPVREFHIDGGPEFFRAADNLEDKGVEIITTKPYNVPSNGFVERSHGIIISLTRTCILQANLPFKSWSYSLRHVVDYKNVLEHSIMNKTLTGHVWKRSRYTWTSLCG